MAVVNFAAYKNVGSSMKGSSMRILLTLALAFGAFAFTSMTESTADAQINGYNNGYGFGAGLFFGDRFDQSRRFRGNRGFRGPVFNNGHIGILRRVEEPPYFAKFPPVYYSHIVKRPYGVSPYAAPPGIAPVEMSFPAPPVTISNPYFDQEAAPVSSESAEPADTNDDVTWVINPNLDPIAINR